MRVEIYLWKYRNLAKPLNVQGYKLVILNSRYIISKIDVHITLVEIFINIIYFVVISPQLTILTSFFGCPD